MEALQASALPLGYTTKIGNIPSWWKKNNTPLITLLMKPIPFRVVAKELGYSHPEQKLITGFAIDSRKISSGDLFFALPGNRVDGHAFLKEVASKGAMGAVIREDFRGEVPQIPLIKVPDVLLSLQNFARTTLEKRSSQVIAITGSLGKTTTKEFTAALLRSRYRIFASPLSYNSQITLPLSILMAEGKEDFLILEMGMTHTGNLKQLISIAPPDIALITTVDLQHVCNFSNGLAGIGEEKASILSHPKTKLGFLHLDMPHFQQAAVVGNCLKKTFSLKSKEADCYLEALPNDRVSIHIKGEPPSELTTRLPSKIHYHNLLAAVAIARALDVPWKLIQEVTPSLQLPPMRFEKIVKQGICFINDAYNANPSAIKGALENLPPPAPGGKVVAVLSEMDALGAYSEEGHRIVGSAALRHADYLLCLGKWCEIMKGMWEQANKPVELFESRHLLEQALKRVAQPGDVILLKGARIYAFDQLLHLF